MALTRTGRVVEDDHEDEDRAKRRQLETEGQRPDEKGQRPDELSAVCVTVIGELQRILADKERELADSTSPSQQRKLASEIDRLVDFATLLGLELDRPTPIAPLQSAALGFVALTLPTMYPGSAEEVDAKAVHELPDAVSSIIEEVGSVVDLEEIRKTFVDLGGDEVFVEDPRTAPDPLTDDVLAATDALTAAVGKGRRSDDGPLDDLVEALGLGNEVDASHRAQSNFAFGRGIAEGLRRRFGRRNKRP